jgi:flagellar motor switch protein FliM
MSEAVTSLELLSREEIGALVDELRRAREQEHETRRLPGLGDVTSDAGPGRTLRRGLERFAAAQSRALASRFQCRLELRLLEVEELRAGELADLLLAHDRLLGFSTPSGGKGFVAIGRPLFFAWMRLAFGALSGLRAEPLPDRPPTPIELRFLRSTGAEMLTELAAALGTGLTPGSAEDASALRDQRATRLIVGVFELSGLDEIGRIRIALPREILGDPALPMRNAGESGSLLKQVVLDAEVAVTASAGTAIVPLARIATLSVGDTLAIDTVRDGLVTVTIDGTPKFRAQRGQLGSWLAIQVIERVAAVEE